MINIKLYGQPSSVYNFLKMNIERQAKHANVELAVEEVNSIDQFVKDRIVSIPTIKIDNNHLYSYSAEQDLYDFILEVNREIFQKIDYGEMKKIIVPTDFSETSTNAFEYAKALAKYLNGIIKLAHFYHPKSVEFEGTVLTDFDTQEIRRKQLDEYYKFVNTPWVGQAHDTIVDKEFVIGFAGSNINDLIHDESHHVIVVGSTGSGGSLKKLFGSTSTSIAKNAKCPVFVIPPKCNFKPFKKVVYACNDQNIDVNAMCKVTEFIQPFKADIYLVHVDDGDGGFTSPELVNHWKEKYPKSKVHVDTISNESVIDGLNDYCIDQDIDCLILATSKRGFFNDLFHKSVTRRMVINTKTPLLICHNP